MPTLTAPDLSKIEGPNIDMPDFDLSKIDLPSKADVSKAVAGAATAVGLLQRRRSRWPYLLGAGLAIGLGGWALMNGAAIRDRLGRAAAWATEKVTTMYREADSEDAIAFPSADTAPSTNDYPDGFGVLADMDSTSGEDLLALDEVTAKA